MFQAAKLNSTPFVHADTVWHDKWGAVCFPVRTGAGRIARYRIVPFIYSVIKYAMRRLFIAFF